MTAVSDFSGLVISAWALARAAAMAPMVSLERCMAHLHVQEVKADGAGFGPLGSHNVAGCLLGVFRHQCLQFELRALVLQECRSGPAKLPGEFRPGVG